MFRAIAMLLLMFAAEVSAQGSPFVPLDDPAYRYIDALMARGNLRSLSALERPYRVRAIHAALASDTTRDRVLQGWRLRLALGIARYEPPAAALTDSFAVSVRATLQLAATAQTSGIREMTRADDSSGVHPALIGRFAVRAGRVVAVSRLTADRRLLQDPEFVGKKDRPLIARVEDAYFSADWRLGEIVAGRVSRNWGPHAITGMQLGDYVYSSDQLMARLGHRRLNLVGILGRLNDIPSDIAVVNRHFAAHRLSGRVGSVELAIGESVVYGGVGRGFEPAFANPMGFVTFAHFTEFRDGNDGNVMYAFDAAWRPRDRGVYSGQLMIDDVQIDECSPLCEEPASYGVTLSAEGIPFRRGQRLFGSYVRVSNLSYRTTPEYLRYTHFNLSLGAPASDFVETRAGVDLAVLPAGPLRVYGAYRMQGEGDYRQAFPSPDQFARTTPILSGIVERTMRVGVSGAAIARRFEATYDLGVNRRSNAGHAPGNRKTAIEGRLRVAFNLPWELAGLARP